MLERPISTYRSYCPCKLQRDKTTKTMVHVTSSYVCLNYDSLNESFSLIAHLTLIEASHHNAAFHHLTHFDSSSPPPQTHTRPDVAEVILLCRQNSLQTVACPVTDVVMSSSFTFNLDATFKHPFHPAENPAFCFSC